MKIPDQYTGIHRNTAMRKVFCIPPSDCLLVSSYSVLSLGVCLCFCVSFALVWEEEEEESKSERGKR